MPGSRRAEHLEHGLVAEHDRRVGLLDAHRAHRRVERQRAGQLDALEAEACRPRPRACCSASIWRSSSRTELGVGDGVDRGPVLGRADHRSRSLDLVGGEEGERQLVELVAAGGKARLDEVEEQRRRGRRSPRAPRSRAPVTWRDLDAYQRWLLEPRATRVRGPGARSRPAAGLCTCSLIRSPPRLPRRAGTSRSRAERASAGSDSSPICGKRRRPNSSTG